jgi:DNA mismatch repair protein MSH6
MIFCLRSSPKSYGPHVASMAGVPRDIVERAISVSQKFEERTVTYEASRKKDQALPLDLQADAAFRECCQAFARLDSS